MKGLAKMTLPHKCIKTRKPLKSKKKAIFGYFSMSHDSVRKRKKPWMCKKKVNHVIATKQLNRAAFRDNITFNLKNKVSLRDIWEWISPKY